MLTLLIAAVALPTTALALTLAPAACLRLWLERTAPVPHDEPKAHGAGPISSRWETSAESSGDTVCTPPVAFELVV